MTLILNGSLDWHKKIEVLPKMKKNNSYFKYFHEFKLIRYKKGIFKMNEMDSKREVC